MEKREREYENQSHQQYTIQIETLQREIKTLQDQVCICIEFRSLTYFEIQLRDRERLLNEIRTEKETLRTQSRKDYEKFDHIHNQVRYLTLISQVVYLYFLLGETKSPRSIESRYLIEKMSGLKIVVIQELENARNDLKRELENERRRFEDLQRKYDKIVWRIFERRLERFLLCVALR